MTHIWFGGFVLGRERREKRLGLTLEEEMAFRLCLFWKLTGRKGLLVSSVMIPVSASDMEERA